MKHCFNLLAAFIALAGFGWSAPFTSIAVYGDSLSDNGNLHALIGYPPPPYYAGRFSNGPVYAEDLATLWGATLADYAVAGATTGLGNFADGGTPTVDNGLPGMTTLFNQTRSTLQVSPNELFIVFGGPNDFRSPAAGDMSESAVLCHV
jgi:phospholipase/lecithinase/hemolysin